MLLEEMRQKVVDYGNQLISSGLTIGTAGNISMYDPETGYMVISPSGIPYAKTTAEDVVVMDFNHPLAGETLHFNGEVIDVHEPTAEEIAALTAPAGGCGCGCDDCGSGCGDHNHEGGCGCGGCH